MNGIATLERSIVSQDSSFLDHLHNQSFKTASSLGVAGLDRLRTKAAHLGLRVSEINNRRYLGNKHGITPFIREVVDRECEDVNVLVDIFSGTGAVANAFLDKTVMTNDLLYSNYLAHIAWFSSENYRPGLIMEFIAFLNRIKTSESNYVRENFADTYFSADDCSKIGAAREMVAEAFSSGLLSERENAILVTSILYGMDRVANTVGHYDAFRQNTEFNKTLDFPILFPRWDLPRENKAYLGDANEVIRSLKCDVLYMDPPYNSRQYSDAYHLLENIARWAKPEVFGVARKMDRSALKSAYSTTKAADALRDLVAKSDARYIVLSYNNMADKGNGRSNAKISDEEIHTILKEKGEVKVFETAHKAFSTGRSDIQGNTERLFVCKVTQRSSPPTQVVVSPINYIGGKGKLISQLKPLLPASDLFVDVFAGGCTVGLNVEAKKVIFNDSNSRLISLMKFLANSDPEALLKKADLLIRKYGLSDTSKSSYAAYEVHSSSGLASVNKDAYLKLRHDFNGARNGARRNLLLYLLVVFGFNNQLRFNGKGEFNLPVGKRDLNPHMRSKLTDYVLRMAEIDHEFTVKDFRKIDIESTPTNTVFYCDPPYLITQATYNERSGWGNRDERDLLAFLDKIHDAGRKFALSNVIESKGRTNSLLQKWISERSFLVHNLQMSYANSNYQRSERSSATLEVLVTNY